MLKLDTKITLNESAIKAKNLAGKFSPEELQKLGEHVWEGYDRDKKSRSAWERRTEAAMNLAMQIQKDKTFPWPNCSNINFPLVTIAALQFHSRAYSTIISGTQIVKCRTIGKDQAGEKQARADRIATYMSYQVMEEDAAWEEQHDRGLLIVPIVGCVFIKTYYSARDRHNKSELVMAKDLVLDYFAKSVEDCARKTHIVPFYRNDIRERVLRGTFRDVLNEEWYQAPPPTRVDAQQAAADLRKGQEPPVPDQDTPFTGLEQHCLLDLDQDGYAEPYIVTIEESSRKVLRIITGFEREEDIERTATGQIISIRRTEYFTKEGFIPAPDGGIYDLGFGVLLGPMNESVNSLINQLTDAGTMMTTAGGFLGRGAKIRGGVYTFAPLEWKRVDSSGDDLRKNVVPLPVRDPSIVLYQLLVLLINYANRIPGTSDTMVGESPGQNTPAETTRTVVEQGMQIYNNLFKRVWRSYKEEFKKLYVLNGRYLPEKKEFGGGAYILREDFLGNPGEVAPAADPNLVSTQARIQQAITIKQAAGGTPGYNIMEVEKNFLRALHVENIDLLYPGPDKVKPLTNPRVQVEMIKLQGKQMQFQSDKAIFAAGLMEERRLNNAKIAKLEAEIMEIMQTVHVDNAKGMSEAYKTAVEALKTHNEILDAQIDKILGGLENERAGESGGQGSPGMGRVEAASANQAAGQGDGGGEGASQGGLG